MLTHDVIRLAGKLLESLSGHRFEVLTIAKPASPDAALNLTKIVSKLSPILGNLIEFNTVEFLNSKEEFKAWGKWLRQDPGFPDTVFEGRVSPTPGFEIKAWYPMATETTARFRDSQNAFTDDQTYVAMLSWLPQNLIYGMPYILDVVVVSAASVAKARDDHYHDPPDYLVLEPRDTRQRTRNLQQTNTNGLKFQGSVQERRGAQKIVDSWGAKGRKYRPTREYQDQLGRLTSQFNYRLDTNYAKMDRIVHPGIEEFKSRVYAREVNGMTVREWQRLFVSENEPRIKAALKEHLGV